MPVLVVVVSAGHSKTILVGMSKLGRLVSRTVIVWTQKAALLQASVAVQVRKMVKAPPQLLLTTSLKVTETWLQESWAVATPSAAVLVSAGHSRTRFVGQKMVGLVVSRRV